MSDTGFDIDTSKLTPANQNPWYILMTLYGEQEGDEIDWELHEKNRQAWNAWACQGMSEEERKLVADEIFVPDNELDPINFFDYGINELFHREWKRRNPFDTSIPKSPDPRQVILIEKTLFSNDLFLNQFVINQIFKASGSIYLGSLYLEFTSFRKILDYTNCKIKHFISKKALFHGDAFFVNTNFYSLECQQSTYFFGANFFKSSIESEFCLNNVLFCGEVNFYRAVFRDTVQIYNCNFTKSIYFDFSKFKTKGFYKEISFSKTQFEGPVYFTNAAFYHVYPDFLGASFSGNVFFSGDPILWPITTKQEPVISRESCATIRYAFATQGLPEEAHFFYRREMYFAGQIGSTVQRLPYLIYGWLSDYGYSIQRPAIGLALVWLFGTAILDTAFQFDFPQEAPLPTAAALSFSNLFPFFGFTGTYFEPGFLRELPAPLKVLSAAQTVLSLPLLFFLGLGLRTRFRMR